MAPLCALPATGAHTRIEALGDTAMYGMLARSANWHNVTEEAVLAAPPSRDTARDMLVNPDPALPPLESVVRTPTFGKDAALITTPGYHRADALWMFSDESLDIPEVPTNPTREQIARARALLVDELLVDFPFVRDSDRAHAVAAILLPFLRAHDRRPCSDSPDRGAHSGLRQGIAGQLDQHRFDGFGVRRADRAGETRTKSGR